MDRSWIDEENRLSTRYLQGVISFFEFALKSSTDGKLACPCKKCANGRRFNKDVVMKHLLYPGSSPSYKHWYSHGELSSTMECNQPSCPQSSIGESSSGTQLGIQQFIEDMITGHEHLGGGSFAEEEIEHLDSLSDINMQVPADKPNDEALKFYDLLNKSDEKLFEGCKNHSKLSFVLDLFHRKSMYGWSNESFKGLLEEMRETLPDGEQLPKLSYEVKKIIRNLGLGYEKIHVCPNNCMLFWKEKVNHDECDICGASRWKVEENDSDNSSSTSITKKKRKPVKVLRWFPLKPRLQRLFMYSKTASLMRWHHDERVDDGYLRHPADSFAWKEFDNRHKEFSSDSHNVRLGLASDGFNPFRTMSITHSTWPVILTVYNLPPWLCMKQPSFILSLLIPGPESPGDKIDVFLQPLIDDLNDLWSNGLETYDACAKKTFQMDDALMWTINDFPAYGMLSGWNTKSRYACPSCGFDTCSMWLVNGGKYCFMGHHRFLPADHRFRCHKRNFDGKEEMRKRPALVDGCTSLKQLDGKVIIKSADGEIVDKSAAWKKKSIFFTLPYWEFNVVRHNLDVMHVEKNVCDNILGTLFNVEGKMKDNLKARQDLKNMRLRKELHPVVLENGKTYIPSACYTLSNAEKNRVLETLKGVKVPESYSSNISRFVKLKQRKLAGLKS